MVNLMQVSMMDWIPGWVHFFLGCLFHVYKPSKADLLSTKEVNSTVQLPEFVDDESTKTVSD